VATEVVWVSSRTRLDWLVFTPIWRRTREQVRSEHGEIDGYLSRTVETAMREAVGTHRHAAVEEKLQELVDVLGVKKTGVTKTFSPSEYSDKTRAAVYVDKSLLARWKEHVDQSSQYGYGVALSKHLWYYLQGGVPEKLSGQVDRVLEEIERDQDTSLSTPERIADRLGESFTREEFLEAANAEGVTTGRYALREHLPAVLEQTGTYPHPNNSDRFIPKGSDTIPATPDPSTLPYQAMDDSDKQLVIKAAAVRRLNDCQGQGGVKFDAGDAVDALDGRPRRSTVRPLMERIADADPDNGFRYDSNAGELRFSRDDVVDASEVNHDALTLALDESVAKTDSGDSGPADQSTDADGENIETASDDVIAAAADRFAEGTLEDLPEVVLRTAIAKEKHPDRVDPETDTIDEELKNRVTDGEIERVREHGTDDTTTPADVDDELELLTGEATAVRADGGRVPPDQEG
jgi:hypothetical protein